MALDRPSFFSEEALKKQSGKINRKDVQVANLRSASMRRFRITTLLLLLKDRSHRTTVAVTIVSITIATIFLRSDIKQ
jgi:hypothetical protein